MHRFSSGIVVLSALLATRSADLVAQPGNFGRASAVAGRDLLIGQPANWYAPGTVYLYRAGAGGRWREAGRLTAPDSSRGDDFGRSLAFDGRSLVVGAPSKGDSAGALYLFRRQGGPGSGFTAVASFVVTGARPRSELGTAVAIRGTTVFVGAPGADSSGVVHQLAITSTGLVGRQALPVRPLAKAARFGAALSLEGDLLLVGAPGADSGVGAAVVFRRQTDGQWREDGVLALGRTPGRVQPRVGTSVLLSAGRAILGAPGAGNGVGAILVYERDPATGWKLAAQVAPGDSGRGSGFGATLAATGGEVWIGAPNAIDRDGAVYRFARSAAGSWTQTGRIRPDSAGAASWPFGFGSSIAVGADVAVIGMPQRDFGEGRALVLTGSRGDWKNGPTIAGEIFKVGSGVSQRTECAKGKLGPFDCSNVEVMSYLPVDQLGGERGVWVNDVWGWTDPATGHEYALVARRDGAAFVDVTNPERPRLVGTLKRTAGSPPSVWRDIKVYKNHAFIVADGAAAHGMQIFDLTRLRSVSSGKPVAFTEDAHYANIHSAHNVVADTTSGHVFVVGSNGGGETCGGGLHMVDVREPKQPRFVGCYTDKSGAKARGYTHDAQCVTYRGPDERYRGREICVGSNEVEINIADVTDKSRPVPIGRSSYPNVAYAHQGWFDEEQRYFYLGDEGDEVSGLVAGTRTLVWDLSKLDDPIVAKEYIGPVQATDHNLFVNGDRVYMSNYGSGLRVLDIKDRANPREVAFIDTAPNGNNEAGMSATASGAWSNYPFFKSGVVVFTSVREGLFLVRVKPAQLVP